MTAAAWTPSPLYLLVQRAGGPGGCTVLGSSQEAGAVSVSLGVRGDWHLAARKTGSSVAASELRLAAGTQTEPAVRRCQSCDFPGQFLLQDTWWGWISLYMQV